MNDAGCSTRGGLIARDAQVTAARENAEFADVNRCDGRGAEIVTDDCDRLTIETIRSARIINAVARTSDAIENNGASRATDIVANLNRLGGSVAVGCTAKHDAILTDQGLAGVDNDSAARSCERNITSG